MTGRKKQAVKAASPAGDREQAAGSTKGRTEADSLVPASGTRFPVVGIGASAGGLEAFEAFFSAMP